MIKFSKSNTITGTMKNICVINGMFVDDETGEVVDLISLLQQEFGDQPFDMKVSRKSDIDD